MSRFSILATLCLAGACAAPSSQSRPTLAAQKSSDDAQAGQKPRLIASLDQAIGPKFSTDGDRFTATIVEGSTLRPGTKLVGRIVDVQAAMVGTMAYAVLIVNGIETENGVEYFDGRVAGVELFQNQPGGREVNASGAPGSEVLGAVIPANKIPQTGSLDRDPLGRGTIISLGTGGQGHQLEKGTRIVVVARERAGYMVAGTPVLTALPGASGMEFTPGGRVKLDDVLVESVIGDVVFWVGNAKNARTLVVLDLVIDEPEERTIVEKGMHLGIVGTTEPMPSQAEAPRLWKLVTAREATGLAGHAYFIHATRIRHK